jgi:hypothetical protein
MATSPVFAVTPRIGSIALSGSADTSYTAPTNVVTVFTGAATGTRIAEVVVQMTATVASATMVRLFLYNGSTYFLFDEVAIAAATGAQAVKQTRVSTSYSNLILPDNTWSLRATVHTVNAGVVIAFGADL